MLRTRLWMGAILVALVVGVLVLDRRLAPGYPFLFVFLMLLAGIACFEFLGLLPERGRPQTWLVLAGVLAVVAANWPAHLPAFDSLSGPWYWVCGAYAALVLAAFLAEMAVFQEHGAGAPRSPGDSAVRIALTVWIVAYLGLLPSFFAQLRWPGPETGELSEPWADPGSVALLLAIFVPKCGDIGAYFTGHFLGRHRMAPTLSPKKTWEGAAGGLAASVAAAVGVNRLGPVIPHGLWNEAAFGICVGAAGMLGDLAESLIKRDCGRKDASQAVPGFGGALDVVDSVIFAAPVAYFWLR
jgi:phosphatidate cytidylyltransferase